MALTEEPDYSKCSMDELYNAACHIDRHQHPEHYSRLAKKVETREAKPLQKERILQRLRIEKRPWREWIFELGSSPRNFNSIREWWDKRHTFYVHYFFTVLGSCLFTTAVFIFVMALKERGTNVFSSQDMDILPPLASLYYRLALLDFLPVDYMDHT